MARGESKGTLRLHVIKRAVILFLLGLVVNGFPLFHLGTLRIYGVLQRIAVCFLFASLLYLWNSRAWVAATTAVVALLGYWILMRWVPIPGIGVPTHSVPLLDPDQNWVAYLDRKLLFGRLYEGVRDPEGLLSDIPAMGTILFGVLTGIWLRRPTSASTKAVGLAGRFDQRVAAGESMERLVPHQQEAMDQLLRVVRRRLYFVAACCVFLCGRDQEVDARLDVSLAGLRLERNHRLCFLGAFGRRPLYHHVCMTTAGYDPAAVHLPALVLPHH